MFADWATQLSFSQTQWLAAVLVLSALAAYLAFALKRQRHALAELEQQQFDRQQQLLQWQRDVEHLELEHERLNEHLVEKNHSLAEQRAHIADLNEARFEAEKLASNHATRLTEVQRQLDALRTEAAEFKQALKQAEQSVFELRDLNSTQEASMAAREQGLVQQLNQLEDNKKLLEQSFQNLASRIFEQQGKRFNDNSQASLQQVLQPFREQISEFRSRVDGIYKENNETTGSLRKELEQLRALNVAMTSDAQNLTEALKGDKKKLGIWGEIQLEKTLQLAGLVKGDHYDTQVHFKDAEGNNNYPDFIVNLPDSKHLILDSKVSLVDYDAAIAAEDEQAQALALARHVQAVKKHIDGLAAKDYSNLIGMKSPSFVLMFMPVEPAYIEAMKHSADLFNYGYHKNVILVSHTTLMPILRTVANLWMMERSHAQVRELSDKAGEVYSQLCMLAERFAKLGLSLQSASKHYNSAVVAIAGQQGLHGKLERFGQLSSKVTKTMPELSPVHVDLERERLDVLRVENADLKAGHRAGSISPESPQQ